jgi:hypothetical protein
MDAKGVDVLALGECAFGPGWLRGDTGAGIAVIAAAEAELAQGDAALVALFMKAGEGFAAYGLPSAEQAAFHHAVLHAGGRVLKISNADWARLAQACKAEGLSD